MATALPALPDKDFFTMGEACRIAQVPPYTLRYWETRVGLPRPARLSSGHRRYTRRDLETILQVKDLIQRRRLTPAGARKTLLGRAKEKPTAPAAAAGSPALTKVLKEIRQELLALARELKDS